MDWRWTEGSSIAGKRIEINTTTTAIKLGLGYHWSADLSVSATANFAVSESNGAGLHIGLIYKFDTAI